MTDELQSEINIAEETSNQPEDERMEQLSLGKIPAGIRRRLLAIRERDSLSNAELAAVLATAAEEYQARHSGGRPETMDALEALLAQVTTLVAGIGTAAEARVEQAEADARVHLDAADEQIYQLEQQVSAERTQRLQAEANAARTAAAAESQVRTAVERMQAAEEAVASLKARLEAVTGERDALKASQDSDHAAVAEAKAELADALKAANEARSALEEQAMAHRAELEEQAAAHRAELAARDVTAVKIKDDAASLRTDIAVAQANLDAASAKAAAAEESRVEAARQLEWVKELLATAHADLDRVRAERDQLRSELAARTAEPENI